MGNKYLSAAVLLLLSLSVHTAVCFTLLCGMLKVTVKSLVTPETALKISDARIMISSVRLPFFPDRVGMETGTKHNLYSQILKSYVTVSSTQNTCTIFSIMVDLFLNRVLVENNTDQDELNTEREIVGILENRILVLFFASSECENCQEFLPVLNDFFKRLKDPAYIEYPKLLALVYIRSLSLLLSVSLMTPCVCMDSHSHCFIFYVISISISSLQLRQI